MTRRNIRTDKPSEARNTHSAAVAASGNFVFTSGITPRDEDGQLVRPGDMAAQIRQTLSNLRDVLQAADTDFGSVVKFTVFVTDIEAFMAARRQADTGLDAAMEAAPALSLVEVSRLAHPDIMVEIEATAQTD
jgi:2-iminobutanoate/2-iminopropanoate deaminase